MEFKYKGKKYDLGYVVEPNNHNVNFGIIVIFTNKIDTEDKYDMQEYEELQKDLEIELREAKRRGATPKELRDIQEEYRDKIDDLGYREIVGFFHIDREDIIEEAKEQIDYIESEKGGK